MKPKLGIYANDFSLYISCVFYSGRIRTVVAMATYSSHRLIIGKVEIDSFCCLTRDLIMGKVKIDSFWCLTRDLIMGKLEIDSFWCLTGDI